MIFFFNLGWILNISSQPLKKEAIFSLSNEKADRIIKSVELYDKTFSTKKIIYYSNKYSVLNNFFLTRDKLKIHSDYIDDFSFIDNPYPLNTYEEIKGIENEMIEKNINSAIIVTDPPHTLRVKIFIELFTTKLKKDYIIVSSEPTWWNKYFYFTNLYAIKFVFLELIKIPYNIIKYGLILS